MKVSRNICKKYRIQVYFKGGKTIKNLLVSPKDKDNIKKKVMLYTGSDVTRLTARRSI